MERIWVLCMSSAGGRAAPVGRPRCARVGGPFGCACRTCGSFAHRSMCGAVLSHSRERTKGRPVAAKPRQHHGCPRTPRRLGCGRNLMLREAIRFLAGAAWNGLGCYVCCPLAAGRHRRAALVACGLVSLSGVSRLVSWHGGTGRKRYGSPHRCMAGGAGVASVGLRRRSPPLSTMSERTSMGEAGRP